MKAHETIVTLLVVAVLVWILARRRFANVEGVKRIDVQLVSWGRQLLYTVVVLSGAVFFLMGFFFCVDGCVKADMAETILQQQAGYLSLIVGLLAFMLVALLWIIHRFSDIQASTDKRQAPPAVPPDADDQAFRECRQQKTE